MWDHPGVSSTLDNQQVIDVLEELRVLGSEQDPVYSTRVRAREVEVGGKFYGRERADIGADAPQAVAQKVGLILYGLVISTRPKTVVEFGTSFGVSTIYLAAGLKDLGRGHLIATELIERKAKAAVENLEAAGMAGIAEVRRGDARETLSDLNEKIDFLFLDGSNDLYVAILEMLEPRLSTEAVIVADLSYGDLHHDHYRTYVGNGARGYTSVEIPIDAGLVISTLR
jgi:predicted O-methyltransferase YrrM